jgi:hypothetical protein
MKLIRQILVAAALSFLGLTVSAQTTSQVQTTPNLITNDPTKWSSIGGYSQLGGQHPIALWGCCTSYSGASPFLDTSTGSPNGQSGQIIWSYGQATVRQMIGINTALSGTGIQVSGYNWGYEVRNMNGDNRQGSYNDVLTATTFLTNSAGTRILQDTRTYSGAQEWNWHGGTVSAPTAVAASNLGNVGVEFTGSDAGFWGGYYGPQVRNVSLSLNYSVNQCSVNPQSSPTCPGYKTYYTSMTDDSYQQVNLPFVFPMYGRTFTTSYMFTNGVVGFLSPENSFCCSGMNLNQNPGSPWNFAIYGLQTDLGPGEDSKFWSQVGDGGTSMRYGWDRVYELGTNNASTFNIQIKNSGYIGINYQSVSVQSNTVTAGIAGDISQGQYSQIYHGWGGAFTPNAQYTFTGTEITDQCAGNPLYSSTCPGYAAAYLSQQCATNSLYDPACPGYATAYFNQQCTANALYNTACPGYATAYYNYQCTASPLYHTGCPGYASAYFNQQCSLNPLYNSLCPGYADAYYVQQCTINPLYDSGCSGYAVAYFNQQCELDPLYNNQCSGYKEAYALKYIVTEKPKTTDSVTVTITTAATVPVVVEPLVAAAPTPVATASPADSATAPVQLVPQPKPLETAAPVETKKETKTTADATGNTSNSSSGSKEQPKTNRQALAERRMEAAREKAAAAAKQNPAAMAAQMDTAGSMEQQVELQAVVLSAMGFVAGFDAYGRGTIPDAAGYKPFEIYPGQRNIDSPAARGLLVRSDRIHQDMVDSQYKK